MDWQKAIKQGLEELKAMEVNRKQKRKDAMKFLLGFILGILLMTTVGLGTYVTLAHRDICLCSACACGDAADVARGKHERDKCPHTTGTIPPILPSDSVHKPLDCPFLETHVPNKSKERLNCCPFLNRFQIQKSGKYVRGM